ncbi:MAG: hypothetical protein HN855_06210 [Anaerolineae bacterium]|jgi:hypothetical protein|nr:hypothetical protein [Anaerolineae bacterium]MBT7070767.1 hypothetical protein [Anaerolineae bacterium]MBT7324732.1 hypothetical protein [Anaerolineae bacterium]
MKKLSTLFLIILFSSLSACQREETLSLPPTSTTPAREISVTATVTVTPTLLPTPDPALNATLQEVEGSVEAKDIVEATFSIAEDGRVVQEEGQVRTLEDGYTRVDLSTGTLIRMAPLSYFTLVSNEPVDDSLFTRIKLELGQIWVVLNGGVVEVETPSGQAAVRGSYMMIEIDPVTQEALITCLEGSCELSNPAGVLQLTNGQRAKLQPPELTEGNFILPPIEEMRERDFAEWLFFAPEAQDIFPHLHKEGILPWEDWEGILPDEDGDFPNLDELFPELPLPPPDDGGLLDGDGILDGDGLLDGDGILDGDGLLDGDGPLGGDGPPAGDGPLGGAGLP